MVDDVVLHLQADDRGHRPTPEGHDRCVGADGDGDELHVRGRAEHGQQSLRDGGAAGQRHERPVAEERRLADDVGVEHGHQLGDVPTGARCDEPLGHQPVRAHGDGRVGILPAVAIVPYFFAGSLFPVSALAWALQGVARVLPLTHTLALLRYGLVGGNTTGLHDIWGMSSPTTIAALSLAVLAAFATGSIALAVRTFTRSAVR